MSGVLTVLRQPRYLALSALMAVVALVCIGLGTWQIARYDWKHGENDGLRHNAEQPVAALDTVLPTLPTQPKSDAIQYRRVSATGSYDTAHQVLVRKVQVASTNGFYVLTPLRTAGGTLLVVRGFQTTTDTPPAPPAGQVTVTARIEPSDTADDKGRELSGQVESVNAAQEAQRLDTTVYAGYAELLADQPGTAGLTVLPQPDLSNPAGGAIEPQHIAYILQWYLFAAIAVAGPLVLARAEARRDDEDAPGPDRPLDEREAREAKLADRYGRTVSRRSGP